MTPVLLQDMGIMSGPSPGKCLAYPPSSSGLMSGRTGTTPPRSKSFRGSPVPQSTLLHPTPNELESRHVRSNPEDSIVSGERTPDTNRKGTSRVQGLLVLV